MEKRCKYMTVIDKNNNIYDFEDIIYDILDNTLLIATCKDNWMFFIENIIGINYD